MREVNYEKQFARQQMDKHAEMLRNRDELIKNQRMQIVNQGADTNK